MSERSVLAAYRDRPSSERRCACGRVVVTADHTKWGVSGLSTICRLSRADTVIADADLDPEAQAVLRGEVGELTLAEPAGSIEGRSIP